MNGLRSIGARRGGLRRLAGLALLALTAVGCTSSASIAPSSKPVSPGQYTVLSRDRVSARSKGFMVLFIPFGRTDPAARALKDCLDENSADALIEVTVHVSQFSLIAFTMVWTTVSGIPVDLRE